jgi:phosphate transport system permease protein
VVSLRGAMPEQRKQLEISLWRRLKDHCATLFAIATVVLVLAPLIAIFGYLLFKGIGSINLAFLTQTPKPPGEIGGGMANAIAGSVLILAIASLIGVPLGIGAGIYLSEFGRNRFGDTIRFVSDVLNGVPSIVIGIVAYALVVLRQKHFSALAGGVALAIMMIPTITRTTEEMLLLVPGALREAAYGLGVPRWRTTLSIVLRTATSGVITGVMLAFARVAGETAPLLFTAFGNQFWNWKLNEPTAALPLQIFTYAISPYDDWHRQAWAGALVLIILIVGAVAAVRVAVRHGTLGGAA